jgi:enoyl-CoA hydratase/carnithine racemase
LETILGCGDIDAATAERWGWVNRAFSDGEVRPFVDALAARIGSFPAVAIAQAKAAVAAAEPDPVPGLLDENQLFNQCLNDPEAIRRMELALAEGAQTRDVELAVQDLYSKLC